MTPEEMSELMNGFARIVTEGISQAIRAGGQGNVVGAGGNGGRLRRMDMKGFEGLEKFHGGEEQWTGWAWKIKVATRAMDPELMELMVLAETNPGRTVGELVEMADPGDLDGRFRGSERGSAELYSVLTRYADGEAGTLVRGLVDMDGLQAYGRLHERYSRRTIGRMFRVQKDCMYPKTARNLGEVAGLVLEWEEKWRRMLAELGPEVRIPELWRMSALLEICPKGVQEQMMLRLDEIGESYEILKAKIISYVTNRVEQGKVGGAVPMDVDEVWDDSKVSPWGGADGGIGVWKRRGVE